MKHYLLIFSLCFLFASPLTAQNNKPSTNERLLLLEEKQNDAEKELEKTKKDLEEKFELKKENLEFQKNQLGWWFNILGILIALFGIVVPLFGFFFGNKLYEKIVQDSKEAKEEFEKLKTESNAIINELRKKKETADDILQGLYESSKNPKKEEAGLKETKKVLESKASTELERTIASTFEFYFSQKYDDAISEFHAILNKYDEKLTRQQLSLIYFALAFSYDVKDEDNKAIDYYTSCLAVDHNNYMANNNRGVAFFKKGEYELALKDYNRALEINPDYAAVILNKTELFISVNKLIEASSLLDQLNKIELNNDDKFYRRFLRFIHSVLDNTNSKKIEECFEELINIVNNKPTNLTWSFKEIKNYLNSKYHENTQQNKKDFIFALIDKLEEWRGKK